MTLLPNCVWATEPKSWLALELIFCLKVFPTFTVSSKLGTVSNDIMKAVNEIRNGLIEIRNDKDGNLGSTIGRKSLATDKLLENFNYFVESIKKEKPDTIKGEFIKNVYITSTMGISYKVGAR